MTAETSAKNSQGIPWLLKSRWFWLALMVLVFMGGIVWISLSPGLIAGTGAGETATELEAAAVAGHPAPEFELKTLEGQTIRLSDFKGQPVLVNFWATWCGPCRAEFPDFQKAWVDNADKLAIIAVNHTTLDQREQIKPFLDEFGVTFEVVLDETGDTAKAYRILGMPTSIFIDRNGIVNEVFTGPINKSYIESKLSELSE
jgi:peroxiredoxin